MTVFVFSGEGTRGALRRLSTRKLKDRGDLGASLKIRRKRVHTPSPALLRVGGDGSGDTRAFPQNPLTDAGSLGS